MLQYNLKGEIKMKETLVYSIVAEKENVKKHWLTVDVKSIVDEVKDYCFKNEINKLSVYVIKNDKIYNLSEFLQEYFDL